MHRTFAVRVAVSSIAPAPTSTALAAGGTTAALAAPGGRATSGSGVPAQ